MGEGDAAPCFLTQCEQSLGQNSARVIISHSQETHGGSRHIPNITRTHNLERPGSSLEEGSLFKGTGELGTGV